MLVVGLLLLLHSVIRIYGFTKVIYY